MNKFAHLQVRNSKDDETPIESATQIFASLLPHSYIPWWKRTYYPIYTYAFEMYMLSQVVYFYMTVPEKQQILASSVVSSSFAYSTITRTEDPMEMVLKAKHVSVGELVLNNYFYLPVKTYFDFTDVDPLSAVAGFMGKQPGDIRLAVQILVTPASFPWQKKTVAQAGHMLYDAHATKPGDQAHGTGQFTQDPQKLLMMKKASFQGGKALLRLIATSDSVDTEPYLQSLAGTFGIFSLGEGNQFVFKHPIFTKKRLINKIRDRSTHFFERQKQILNAQELASIWHPPGFLMAGVKNISWGKTLSGEPPENLPIVPTVALAKDGLPIDEAAVAKAEAAKQDINFFAQTEFKNQQTIFGIKTADRRKHVYIIGKTGAGKSTLIANMAIDDIRKGRGIGIIDPHGDLSETILEYIPKRRINDVVYLEPFDQERPFSLNVLEIKNEQQRDLVASGIVSIFYKIYGTSWGPRLEYILRNVILTLLEIPGATLVDVLRLLSDATYRTKAVAKVKDPVIKDFWEKEFARMPDSMKAEAISPIQNKVGQFVSSKMIRNIIGKPKSTIDLEKIMNEGKILILNLSQGKLGEDNAALLGAMIITQLQLAAMNRSFIKEEDRRDFFLYVDEFQNFATTSFVKILSEARKYRLCLSLANQYMGQLEEEMQHAIFGNVGTLMSFVVGAADAYILTKEYAEIYTENDLVSLGKHEVVMKLSIDGMTSAPFPAGTLPLPSLKNENKEKIIQLSKEKFGRKVDAPEEISSEPAVIATDKPEPIEQ